MPVEQDTMLRTLTRLDSTPVTVAGVGTIADAIRTALGTRTADAEGGSGWESGTPEAPEAVLVSATDCWPTPDEEERLRTSEPESCWLPIHTELGALLIGPTERAGTTGCVQCVRLRRDRIRENHAGWNAVRERHGSKLAERPSAWLTGLALRTTTAIVLDELARLLRSPETARTRRAVLRIGLDDLKASRLPFLPEPFCPVCGDLPEDQPERARITLEPRPKPAPDSYRVRNVVDKLDQLTDLYVDAETGMIRPLRKGNQGGLAVAIADMPLRFANLVEPGSGRGRSYRGTAVTAVLEALERYGGVEPGGSRTVVEATMAELTASGHQVLDPRVLGVHPPNCYERPDFRYRPFDEHQRTRWVWGHSFRTGEEILVPESCAYYYLGHAARREDQPFVYEISNGCALGSCLEEAILYGILEAVERDGFLMTWYARMPAARIDPDTAIDRTIGLQHAAIENETGYRVRVFDTTMEHGICSVWAMALRPDHANPDPQDPKPMSVSSAGSHFTLERAVLGALNELGPMAHSFPREYAEVAEDARAMVHEPSLVTKMRDHAPLYGTRQGFERLRFLVDTPYLARLDSPLARPEGFGNPDLTDDLRAAIRRLADAGMDVVVVDQTTTEHHAGGFRCVKVLVPGTMPMTFGYDFRRIHGLPRPLTVPRLLGYRATDLRVSDLNPHPHPFP